MTMMIRDEIDRVFRDELSLEPPVPGTDLIASGLLDSLAIVALLVELEHRFGIQVPLDSLDLETIRTVERLEKLIADSRPEEADLGSARAAGADPDHSAILVQLRAGTALRPFFLVHDSYSGAPTIQPIAAALITDRPVYGIQARGLDASRQPDRTVEAMATAYVAAIRELQPEGPYALGGNSFGGLVAYEMARLLAADGETVEHLIMVDTQVHFRALPAPTRRRFRLGKPLRYARFILTAPRERVPLYLRKLGAKLQGKPQVDPVGAASRQLPPRLAELKRIADAAEAAYRPGRYPGDATLLLARTRAPSKCSPGDVWASVVEGQLRVVGIPGDHGDTLTSNLEAVGARLSDALSE